MIGSRKTITLVVTIVVIALSFPSAFGAVCPNNIPVVTLPPHSEGGFSWGNVIRPMGDACVANIAVEPTNAMAWYVGGQNGLYMTKNGGQSWTHPLNGMAGPLLLVPGPPNQLVYVGIAKTLFLSRDHGQNWTAIKTFSDTVRSLLVNGGTLYVGLAWSTHAVPSGVWTANLGGGLAQFHPFGPGQTGLIVWTLSRDPLSGMIYAGTEIFDHLPQPYKPPFFRTSNGGLTWTNVAGNLPWHVIDSAVRPNDGFVYALTEGLGVYGSATQGTIWQPPTLSPGLGNSLLMDPNKPTRLFVGRVKFNNINGGFFVSKDAGKTYSPAGLEGVTVAGLAVNGGATKIYAATYASGIYISTVPPP
ncbi:MAG TPA: hypothetical protein VF713_21650 [Thermoanaerobaculia bacterium]